MTQREFVVSTVRLIGAYFTASTAISLAETAAMGGEVMGFVPAAARVIQLGVVVLGIYLLVSGRVLINFVCRPE